MAFTDANNGNKAAVKYFDGSDWLDLGQDSISEAAGFLTTIAAGSGGSLYLAFKDANDNAAVYKYNGASNAWEKMDIPTNLLEQTVDMTMSVIDSNVYLMYGKSEGAQILPRVLRYGGGYWRDASPREVGTSASYYGYSIAGGSLYLFGAFYDDSNGNILVVTSNDYGAMWFVLDSIGTGRDLEIFSVSSAPFVAYADSQNAGRLTVKRLTSDNWTVMGEPGISAGQAQDISIYVDIIRSVVYVAFIDQGSGGKLVVKRFKLGDNKWENVGEGVVSDDAVSHADLYVYNGTPYVAFSEGDAATVKVKKFAGARVKYEGNEDTGGSSPRDDNFYQEGDTVTVLGNTGNLIRTGYTFAGWNTRRTEAERAALRQFGIVSGYQDGTFRPGDTISRQAAVVMLNRAMKWTGLSGSPADAGRALLRFADADEVAAWAKDAMAAAVGLGLVQGSSGRLNPNGELTRAEAAAIVQRLLKQSGLID